MAADRARPLQALVDDHQRGTDEEDSGRGADADEPQAPLLERRDR